MEQLVSALQAAVAHQAEFLHSPVHQITRDQAGFHVRLDADTIDARHVILATPAHAAAVLTANLDPDLSALLAAIPYSSSVTAALAYRKRDVPQPLNGFGFLVPRKERRQMVACTYVGTKFSHRVPDDGLLLRCFLGGAGNAAILHQSDESILSALLGEVRHLTGVAAQPLFSTISRWPDSMAQYTVGHLDRVKAIEQQLSRVPSLHLAGNAFHGIGIPDCVRSGKLAAEKCAGLPLRID
jgi:oxygen-dependent protoporphyrinogen oxidase